VQHVYFVGAYITAHLANDAQRAGIAHARQAIESQFASRREQPDFLNALGRPLSDAYIRRDVLLRQVQAHFLASLV